MAVGNATIWKPSPSTPLCSIAVTKIVAGVLEKNGVPGAVAGLVTGGKDVGEALVQSQGVDMGENLSLSICSFKSVNLWWLPVSFTGSEKVGRVVGKNVQSRFGKVLLELGGNNGSCTPSPTRQSLTILIAFKKKKKKKPHFQLRSSCLTRTSPSPCPPSSSAP